MKKITLLLTFVVMLSGCYKDDIRDLNNKYDDLKKEQDRQAELLVTYKTLLDALANKLTITGIVDTEDGYKIIFSNGTELEIKNGKDAQTPVITIGENGNWYVDGVDTGKKSSGQDGVTPSIKIKDGYWYLNDVNTGVRAEADDGKGVPYIVTVVDVGGTIVFYMSDGSTIKMGKMETTGLWALAEGVWGAGSGQLVYFDYNLGTKKFVRNNDLRFRNYAETPNDLIIYGTKMYCAISGASKEDGGILRVINAVTGETIQDITIEVDTKASQPRRLAKHNGKIYATLYSGAIAQIDTSSFATKVTKLSGTYSDGICSYKESLYVCNSGQGEGNTISVVDIAQFKETETITVPYNPVNIVSAGNGELFFNTCSVWSGPTSGDPANIHVLNTTTKLVTKTFDIAAENIAIGKNYVYGTATTSWTTYDGMLKKISITDKSVSDFTTNTSKLMFAYKLSVNPVNHEVFVTQQLGQGIIRFQEDGTWIETLMSGQQNGAVAAFTYTVK